MEARREAVGVLNTAVRCDEYCVRPMVQPMLLR